MKYILLLLLPWLGACAHQSTTGYSGHGADSVPAELIEKFAPKPLDPQELERIEALLDVRSPMGGLLSPDGKTLFFSWSVTGTNQVWKISKSNSFPVQMTGGQDGTRLRDITPDGRYLILNRDQKGNEYPFLYIQSVEGGPLHLIDGQKKVITSPAFVSDDSRYVYYTKNDEAPTKHSLYRYDIKAGGKEKILDGIPGYMEVSDHLGDNLLLSNATGNWAREIYTYNLKTKELKPIFGKNENIEYVVQFGQNANEILVLTNKFEEYRRLYSYKDGKFTAITPKITADIETFSIDEKRRRILYEVNDRGYTDVKGLSAKTFKSIKVPMKRGAGDLHAYFGSTTPNSRYTIFMKSPANAPTQSFVYDWNTGSMKQWVYPSSPEIKTDDFVTPTLSHYVARDGTQIPMFVMRPKQCTPEKNCPVIVSFHGGPESQARPRFAPTYQLYMEQGFVLVMPNVRGSDGYGKTWLDSDNGPKRLNVITDIEDASRYIKKEWAVNGVAPKIGVMGGSYGGYSTNMAMTMFAGAYDAGVSIVGMSSLVTFLENTGPFRRHLRASEYGDPEKDLDALKKLSPVTYLDNIEDPMLIVHGATDPRVPAGEAIQIYNAMDAKGLDGQLILFADEGHGVRKRKNLAVYYGHMIDFFNKHLKK